MVLHSMWRSPEQWTLDSHGKTHKLRTVYWAENEELDIKVWCANGLPYFEFQKMTDVYKNHTFPFSFGPKVKLTILQTTILHIAYLKKVRKYSYLGILFRYLIGGLVTLGIGAFVTILLVYLNNYNNKEEIELDVSKSEVLDRKLDQILN